MKYYSVELGSKLVNKVTGAIYQVTAAKIEGETPIMVYTDSYNKPLRAYGRILSIQAAKLDASGIVTDQTITISEKNDLAYKVVYSAPTPDYCPDINKYSVEDGCLLNDETVIIPKGELYFKNIICSMKNKILLLAEHIPTERECLVTYEPLAKRSLGVEKYLAKELTNTSSFTTIHISKGDILLYRTGSLSNGTDEDGNTIFVPGYAVYNFVRDKIVEDVFNGTLLDIYEPKMAASTEEAPAAFMSFEKDGRKYTNAFVKNEWKDAPFGHIESAYYCGDNTVLIGDDKYNINEITFYGKCPVDLEATPWLIDESNDIYSFTDDRCSTISKFKRVNNGPAGYTLEAITE